MSVKIIGYVGFKHYFLLGDIMQVAVKSLIIFYMVALHTLLLLLLLLLLLQRQQQQRPAHDLEIFIVFW